MAVTLNPAGLRQRIILLASGGAASIIFAAICSSLLRVVSSMTLTRLLDVDVEALSGSAERSLAVTLREALTDPLLGAEPIGEEALAAIAVHPAAARAILALSRAWAAAREDASGIALPSGRRIKLPHEEARALFNEHANHFPTLEQAADAVRLDMEQQGMPAAPEPTDIIAVPAVPLRPTPL